MATARCRIVDLSVTRYYHCISRCVRGSFLCGPGYEHRKKWLENRLEHLVSNFAIAVAGFVIMDNHMHVLVRIDPERMVIWSDEEVIRRWITVFPPKDIRWHDEDNVQMWIERYGEDPQDVAEYRKRLGDLGWFMKTLKQPLAFMANREDDVRGSFWDARFKSIAVLDEEAILATCAYIDLNPVAAGVSLTPETSQYTSIRQRVAHFRFQGKLSLLKSARCGSIEASRTIGNAEQDHWLVPFEDRRPHTRSQPASSREGMLEKFTLGNYLMLVDYTGRQFREGKARISDSVQEIFERLETSREFWSDRLKKMLAARSLRGRCFAGSAQGMKQAIEKGLSPRAINLSPQA